MIRPDRPGAQDVTRIAVRVTFLRMSRPPAAPAPRVPDGMRVVRIVAPGVAFYRELYDAAGADYCWWLRRVMPDRELERLMERDGWSLHVLECDGRAGGFYELEPRGGDVNLAYFGLLPHMIGRGAGRALLRHAIDTAWSRAPRHLFVNTCTADHPRALGLYLDSGFQPLREITEIWDIPDSLGLKVPHHLRV